MTFHGGPSGPETFYGAISAREDGRRTVTVLDEPTTIVGQLTAINGQPTTLDDG